ncbi:PREDICTED: uncharacterized protein LOC109169472 [Ipomoea nil]|uniref:uncharacterized protein LOC109169472 n=1 Tax=Ipomoea nil TaxID=35883 RepID=UPI00090190E5|nr:PREDICTED: uncharacterized protein LOC109169472 [Ipomoea nil]
MATTIITIEDLHLFHTIDRRVFSRLLINLARTPAESLLVMALWLWLEDLHFQTIYIVDKLDDFSDSVVDALANEAVLCLKCLEPRSSSGAAAAAGEDDMPLTSLVTGRPMSSHRFYPNKFAAISGIKAFLNKVCAVVFADILQQVMSSGITVSLSQVVTPDSAIPIPGFPHPTFGAISVIPRSPDFAIPNGGFWGWSTAAEAPVDDRTMFLTFSRGYPVSEEEVKELFNLYYGDCVETVKMVPPATASEQSLYARLVVRSVSTIDQVLSRGPIAKFRVNGKHVWARKYERRDMYVDQ